jgi:ankyrin repeat protein
LTFTQINERGIFPLAYAIKSLCVENVAKFIHHFNGISIKDQNKFALIINQRNSKNENFFHQLAEVLNEKNYEQVFELVEILLKFGCNPNLVSKNGKTPLTCLMEKCQNEKLSSKIVEHFIANANLNFYDLNSEDNFANFAELGLKISKSERKLADSNFMLELLRNCNEKVFNNLFDEFKSQSVNFVDDCLRFLETAISMNLNNVVKSLIANGTNVKAKNLLFLSCQIGNVETFKYLLSHPQIELISEDQKTTILHELLKTKTNQICDVEEMFFAVIRNKKCSKNFINSLDSKEKSPLYYACANGFDFIVTELLLRDAYIGTCLSVIKKDLLRNFLDECISTKREIDDENFDIFINFGFLKNENKSKICSMYSWECKTLNEISKNVNLEDFILHPTLRTFIHLKWQRMNFLVYANIFVYFFMLLSMGIFVTAMYRNDVYHPESQFPFLPKVAINAKKNIEELSMNFNESLNSAHLLHPIKVLENQKFLFGIHPTIVLQEGELIKMHQK